MLKKSSVIVGLALIVLSSFPLFLMARESYVSDKVFERYELTNARVEFGYNFPLDSPITKLGDYTIEIIETPTGRKEKLELYEIESGDVAREIVKAQITVNGKKVGEPYEVMLGARSDHTRYHRFIEIMNVQEEDRQRVAIIVTKWTDSFQGRGEWDIIWLEGDNISIETFQRGDNNHLATRIVNTAGLTDMSFGYYSDIHHFYPTIFMPFLYPFGSAIVGVLLLVFGVISHLVQRRKRVV